MARDWVSIVQRLEGLYPQVIGGSSRDDTIRQLLVPFANDAMEEISRDQRWMQNFSQVTQVTTQGTQTYALPANFVTVRRCYWEDANGRPQPLERWDRLELQRVYGDPVAASTVNQGAPTKFSLDGTNLFLFPVPNFSGPQAGNYTIQIEGYTRLLSIVETAGTTTAASATLTVPSTAYLTDNGVPTSTILQTLSVRGAGNLGVGSVASTFYTTWSAFPSATTVTMTGAAVTAVPALGAQVFFNSVNWLITDWPDVLTFKVLCAIANYYGSNEDQHKYEGLYALRMQKMRDYEFDRARGEEVQGVWQVGQRAPGLRRQDSVSAFDVRGG